MLPCSAFVIALAAPAVMLAVQPSLDRLLAEDTLLASPGDLPLVGPRTSTVYRGIESHSKFNLHSYLAVHENRFWAMWSSSAP